MSRVEQLTEKREKLINLLGDPGTPPEQVKSLQAKIKALNREIQELNKSSPRMESLKNAAAVLLGLNPKLPSQAGAMLGGAVGGMVGGIFNPQNLSVEAVKQLMLMYSSEITVVRETEGNNVKLTVFCNKENLDALLQNPGLLGSLIVQKVR